MPPDIPTDNVPVVDPKVAPPYIDQSTLVPSVTACTVATLYLAPVESDPLTNHSTPVIPVTDTLDIA